MLRVELPVRAVEVEISAITIALASTGALVLGTAIGMGVSSQSTAGAELGMRQSQQFYDARELEATLANVMFAVGGATLVAALISVALDVTAAERSGTFARLARGEVASW